MVIRSRRPIYDRIVGKSPKYPHTNFQWHIKCGLASSSIEVILQMMTSTGLTLTFVENDFYIAGIIFWCTKKKIEQWVPRARPDANADANANRSKTICRPPLKGGPHNNIQCLFAATCNMLGFMV